MELSEIYRQGGRFFNYPLAQRFKDGPIATKIFSQIKKIVTNYLLMLIKLKKLLVSRKTKLKQKIHTARYTVLAPMYSWTSWDLMR